MVFAIHSFQKPRFKSPKHLRNQARNTIEISGLGAMKAFKGSPNHFKINENPVPDHPETIQLLPWCSKALPRCRNGPPGCKIEAPSRPNGNHEELKGPAAEGAALRIKFFCFLVAGGACRTPTDPGFPHLSGGRSTTRPHTSLHFEWPGATRLIIY